MSFDFDNFDPSAYKSEDRGFKPYPAGKYKMQVIQAAIKTWDNGGETLNLKYAITADEFGGEYEGKTYLEGLSLGEAWGLAALADWTRSAGVKPKNPEEFVGHEVVVELTVAKVKKGAKAGQMRNYSKYLPKDTKLGTQPAAPTGTAPSTAADEAAPW